MAITNDLNEVISLAKESAMDKIKGNQFFERDTHNFFKGFIEIFNQMNETIGIEKMKDLIQPNFQAIYMLIKANKDKEINCLAYALDENDFIMKNIHSLTAIKESLIKKEIDIYEKNSQLNMQLCTQIGKNIFTKEQECIILELCVDEAIKLPKGQVPHLFDDYKNGFIKIDEEKCLLEYSRGKICLSSGKKVQ